MPRDIYGNLIKEDIWTGKKIPKKQIKKEVIAENRRTGKLGEDNIRARLEFQGYEVERTPHGKDFIARKRQFITGRVIQTKHIEVKTGKAKLSRLQQKTKKNKSNYQVIREQNPYDFSNL